MRGGADPKLFEAVSRSIGVNAFWSSTSNFDTKSKVSAEAVFDKRVFGVNGYEFLVGGCSCERDDQCDQAQAHHQSGLKIDLTRARSSSYAGERATVQYVELDAPEE